MTTSVFSDYEALSNHVAEQILSAVEQNPDAVLCLAAGDTPTRAYALLVEKAKTLRVDFSRCSFIGLDEWVGIPPTNEGSCHYYLQKNLFLPLNISPAQIHLFDALAGDLQAECDKMNRTIGDAGGIDLMLVGVGMNGHIGFNEPGAPLDKYAHVVDLDTTTQSVGQKYFRQSTKLLQGITLGLKHFLESRRGILMASGIRKAKVISRALKGPVTAHMPASAIQKHPNGVAMLDAEAAGMLDG
jgi:galactosamine-6-phosphate isomerase